MCRSQRRELVGVDPPIQQPLRWSRWCRSPDRSVIGEGEPGLAERHVCAGAPSQTPIRSVSVADLSDAVMAAPGVRCDIDQDFADDPVLDGSVRLRGVLQGKQM